MVQADENNRLDEKLIENFTNIFRKGYINIDGVTLPRRYEEMKEEIDNWEVNEEDVWICSFPKTGTTWTQEMVWMIINNLDFEEGKLNLGHRSPFLEVTALFDYRDLMKNNPDFKPPPFIENSLNFVKNQKGPLTLKTHLPWNLLPKQIQNGTKKPKIIYIARNPYDTCLSYFHHSKLMESYRGNFEEFFELFLAGKLNFAPYWKHLLSFWERRHEPNILFLKYEDLKKDLTIVIRQVANFLERNLTEEEVETLTNHLSFDSMKNNPAVNYDLIVSLGRKFNLINYDGCFMRSGKVGDYKESLTTEKIQRIQQWIKDNTKGTDFNEY